MGSSSYSAKAHKEKVTPNDESSSSDTSYETEVSPADCYIHKIARSEESWTATRLRTKFKGHVLDRSPDFELLHVVVPPSLGSQIVDRVSQFHDKMIVLRDKAKLKGAIIETKADFVNFGYPRETGIVVRSQLVWAKDIGPDLADSLEISISPRKERGCCLLQ